MNIDNFEIYIDDDSWYEVTTPAANKFGLIKVYHDQLPPDVKWYRLFTKPPQTVTIYKTMIIQDTVQTDSWMSFSDPVAGLPHFMKMHHDIIREEVDIITYWEVLSDSPWYTKKLDDYILLLIKNRNVLEQNVQS